jgi:hypothetical protein
LRISFGRKHPRIPKHVLRLRGLASRGSRGREEGVGDSRAWRRRPRHVVFRLGPQRGRQRA